MAFGNGMRPDVWSKFQERFNIPTIFEYYTMSEGKTSNYQNDLVEEYLGIYLTRKQPPTWCIGTGALLNIGKNLRDVGAVGYRGPIIR